MSAPLVTGINGVASATPSIASSRTTADESPEGDSPAVAREEAAIASTVVAASAPIEPPWRDVLQVDQAADLMPPPSDEELLALALDIEAHGIHEAIVLRRNPNGEVVLLDGRSRLTAGTLAALPIVKAGKLNLDLIPHRFEKPDVDPVALVLSLNLHRRHLTPKQKRGVIAKVLKAKPESSNNAIAKQVKADDKTVAKVRAELERSSDIPKIATRTDANGHRRPAHKTHTPVPASQPAKGHNGSADAPRPIAANDTNAGPAYYDPERSATDRKAYYARIDDQEAEILALKTKLEEHSAEITFPALVQADPNRAQRTVLAEFIQLAQSIARDGLEAELRDLCRGHETTEHASSN